jgi:hypothetical protein
MLHEPCRACVLLIAFIVPDSVSIVVQVRNRTLAEATTALRAVSMEAGRSRDVQLTLRLESLLPGFIRVVTAYWTSCQCSCPAESPARIC